MKISKAVVTAAAPAQRALPLQTLIDRDGAPKTALRVIIEEAAAAGAQDICVVICPGDREAYAKAAGVQGQRLTFIEQPRPRGYADALLCARAFTGADPFLHLVSDHLPLSKGPGRCAQQLVETASAEACAVSAVQATRETMLPYFGAVGGRRVARQANLYEVDHVIEKPTPTEAEQALLVPGLRAGHYLCFFGMHVLTPTVMDLLAERQAQAGPDARLPLSAALAGLSSKERYLALELKGTRFDIGSKYGLLFAQLAFALDGAEREEILIHLVEMLATRRRGD